jgi:hypothetical protein
VVVSDGTCARLVASPIDLALNTCGPPICLPLFLYALNLARVLAAALVAVQFPQCLRTIRLSSAQCISSYHFWLDFFYQSLFVSCVLYISSLNEGPIECCRRNGRYGREAGTDTHLAGWEAFGVLLGIIQAGIVFLGSLVRCVTRELLCTHTPKKLTGTALSSS